MTRTQWWAFSVACLVGCGDSGGGSDTAITVADTVTDTATDTVTGTGTDATTTTAADTEVATGTDVAADTEVATETDVAADTEVATETDVATDADVPQTTPLRGSAEKGPLVAGSTVTVSVVDAALAPVGRVYPTQTTSDLGDFAIPDVDGAAVELVATGFYLLLESDYYAFPGADPQIDRALSDDAITLRGYAAVAPGVENRGGVNLVTHMTHARTKKLVEGGAPLADAALQAERELAAALAITTPSFVPSRSAAGSSIIGPDDDDNAYLLLVSMYASQYSTADVQDGINAIDLDLGSDGALQTTTRDRLFVVPTQPFPVAAVRYGIELVFPGSSAPDPRRIMDSDGDERVDSADNCPFDANAGQADGDSDGVGDACDGCPTLACLGIQNAGCFDGVCFARCGPLATEAGACSDQARCTGTALERVHDAVVGWSVCEEPCDPTADTCPEGQWCARDGATWHCKMPAGDYTTGPFTGYLPLRQPGENLCGLRGCELGYGCESPRFPELESTCKRICDPSFVPAHCTSADEVCAELPEGGYGVCAPKGYPGTSCEAPVMCIDYDSLNRFYCAADVTCQLGSDIGQSCGQSNDTPCRPDALCLGGFCRLSCGATCDVCTCANGCTQYAGGAACAP